MKYCKKCGFEMDDRAQICDECGEVVEKVDAYDSTVKTGKKNKGAGVGFITTIIFIIIGRLIGGFIGGSVGKAVTEEDAMNKINEYIESMNDYTPGSLGDDKYASSHFGFQFETDDNWTMYSESELEVLSADLRESTVSSGVKSLEVEDIGEELIEKWKEALYAEAEMAAFYIADDIIVGEVSVGVFGAYGLDEVSSEDLIDEMKNQILDNGGKVSFGVENIAEEEYQSLKLEVTVDGMDLVNRIFMREKEGMFCMITCKALEGYEDEIFASFREQTSKN